MAITSLTCSSSIIPFFLVMFVIVITPTMSNSMLISKTNDILSDVCSKSLNISYCMQVINTIPGCPQIEDFKNLTQISITYTLTKCKDNLNYVMFLVKQPSDPRLKNTYKTCNASYSSALDYVEDAQNYFNFGDFGGVNIQASNAMDRVDDCQEKLIKNSSLPDPSQLPHKNEVFNILCEIIEIAANKIIGTY